ncbi:MAG: deoxyguanosinetriphosphate triphosphohydrolase [Candidatus Omnitrophota bacterium]
MVKKSGRGSCAFVFARTRIGRGHFHHTRLSYQKIEEKILAPYAVHSAASRGRRYPEKEHAWRTPFQRDRDRILHTAAFRRLQYKTQVFINHEGDHYRTRLTHTLETCQIARSMARMLRLNEDLVEAIALAHDLGHGPFGHAGEWALQEMMKNDGGFEHNLHTLRLVEDLEDNYQEFPGLNLTYETLEGLKKHPEILSREQGRCFRSLEADLVDRADEIAYTSHDLDDGLRSGLLTEGQVNRLSLWCEAKCYCRKRYPRIDREHRIKLIIRLLINHLVADVFQTSLAKIRRYRIDSLKALQGTRAPIITLSAGLTEPHQELKEFLYKKLYQHAHVLRMTEKVQGFVKKLFSAYRSDFGQLPREVRDRFKKDGPPRAICDYLAGMTDRFALNEYRRLFEFSEEV